MSFEYFNKLNYSMANEDTRMEWEMLDEGVGHVLSVAGSGSRVLPLLAKKPKKVTCVDLSNEQLYLTEMRFEGCRQLSHDEWLKLIGYREADNRKEIFEKLELSDKAKRFMQGLYEALEWEGILYQGKWEQTFIKLSKINAKFTGSKGTEIFESKDLASQISYYESDFPKKKWQTVVFMLGNGTIFNAMLYKGHFPKKNVVGTHSEYYGQAFDRLFRNGLLNENYFMELLFYGKVKHETAFPFECNEEAFAAAKEGLQSCEVQYKCGNILEVVQEQKTPIDFLSFSDVPSYFSGNTEIEYMQKVRENLAPGAMVVLRHYLHIPFRTDLRGYEDVTYDFQEAIGRERTQMYYVDVLKKI